MTTKSWWFHLKIIWEYSKVVVTCSSIFTLPCQQVLTAFFFCNLLFSCRKGFISIFTYWIHSITVNLVISKLTVTKSREVDLSPVNEIKRFLFAFRTKNREWRDSYPGFLVTFLSPWLHWFHSEKNNPTCVCFSDIEWANLLTWCVSCHKRRRPQAGGKKNKACFHLKSILGKEIFFDSFVP